MEIKENKITPGNYETGLESEKTPLDLEAADALIKPQIENLKREIENSKRDLVTILGIFVSFITFTSVDFQLLKNITNISDYISLTFLLLLAMLTFVFGFKNFLIDEIDTSIFKKPLFITMIALLFLSIMFYAIPRLINLSNKQRMRIENAGIYLHQ